MTYKLFGNPALEEMDPASVTPEETPTEEIVDDIEEGVVLVENSDADVEAASAALDEGAEAIQTLDEIKEVIEAKVESGEGLSEDAAEIAAIAVESIYDRIGYTPKKRAFPATEDFEGRNSSLAASRIAVEGIKEAAVAIWEAIKKMIAVAKEKLQDFYRWIRGFLDKTTKQLSDLIKRTRKLKAEGAVAADAIEDWDVRKDVKHAKNIHCETKDDVVRLSKDYERLSKQVEELVTSDKEEAKVGAIVIKTVSDNDVSIDWAVSSDSIKEPLGLLSLEKIEDVLLNLDKTWKQVEGMKAMEATYLKRAEKIEEKAKKDGGLSQEELEMIMSGLKVATKVATTVPQMAVKNMLAIIAYCGTSLRSYEVKAD